MNSFEVVQKAGQILDEECSAPTVLYSWRKHEGPTNDLTVRFVEGLSVVAYASELRTNRSQRPRPVDEDPGKWQFQSVNYDLLCALLSQTPEDLRNTLLFTVLNRLYVRPGCRKSISHYQFPWNGLVSEFPLVAEFCIRNGAKEGFIRVLGELEPIAGHAVLLRHLEEVIALNFTVFTNRDYEALVVAIETLGRTASNKDDARRKSGATGGEEGQLYHEIIEATKGIREECRKARYLYLKGDLLEGFNLEINQDKAAVESYLKSQGFSDALIECLNRADQIYRNASSGFEFKSSMGHLRSFMERLHSEGLTKLRITVSGPASRRWGTGLKLLREKGMLTQAEEHYASALFTLLSDEGVHPVFAEKEYARLARNVVIEYALLFLRKLGKVGPTLAEG